MKVLSMINFHYFFTTHVANFPSHMGQYIVPVPSHDLSRLRASLLTPEDSLCRTWLLCLCLDLEGG